MSVDASSASFDEKLLAVYSSEVIIQKVNHFIFQLQGVLCSQVVEPIHLEKIAKLIRPVDYDGVVEERQAKQLCSFPGCTNNLPARSSSHEPQFQLLIRQRAVVAVGEEGAFCSPACQEASRRYRASLSDAPLTSRDVPFNFTRTPKNVFIDGLETSGGRTRKPKRPVFPGSNLEAELHSASQNANSNRGEGKPRLPRPRRLKKKASSIPLETAKLHVIEHKRETVTLPPVDSDEDNVLHVAETEENQKKEQVVFHANAIENYSPVSKDPSSTISIVAPATSATSSMEKSETYASKTETTTTPAADVDPDDTIAVTAASKSLKKSVRFGNNEERLYYVGSTTNSFSFPNGVPMNRSSGVRPVSFDWPEYPDENRDENNDFENEGLKSAQGIDKNVDNVPEVEDFSNTKINSATLSISELAELDDDQLECVDEATKHAVVELRSRIARLRKHNRYVVGMSDSEMQMQEYLLSRLAEVPKTPETDESEKDEKHNNDDEEDKDEDEDEDEKNKDIKAVTMADIMNDVEEVDSDEEETKAAVEANKRLLMPSAENGKVDVVANSITGIQSLIPPVEFTLENVENVDDVEDERDDIRRALELEREMNSVKETDKENGDEEVDVEDIVALATPTLEQIAILKRNQERQSLGDIKNESTSSTLSSMSAKKTASLKNTNTSNQRSSTPTRTGGVASRDRFEALMNDAGRRRAMRRTTRRYGGPSHANPHRAPDSDSSESELDFDPNTSASTDADAHADTESGKITQMRKDVVDTLDELLRTAGPRLQGLPPFSQVMGTLLGMTTDASYHIFGVSDFLRKKALEREAKEKRDADIASGALAIGTADDNGDGSGYGYGVGVSDPSTIRALGTSEDARVRLFSRMIGQHVALLQASFPSGVRLYTLPRRVSELVDTFAVPLAVHPLTQKMWKFLTLALVKALAAFDEACLAKLYPSYNDIPSDRAQKLYPEYLWFFSQDKASEQYKTLVRYVESLGFTIEHLDSIPFSFLRE